MPTICFGVNATEPVNGSVVLRLKAHGLSCQAILPDLYIRKLERAAGAGMDLLPGLRTLIDEGDVAPETCAPEASRTYPSTEAVSNWARREATPTDSRTTTSISQRFTGTPILELARRQGALSR